MTTIVLKCMKKTEPFTTSDTARSHFTARVLTLLDVLITRKWRLFTFPLASRPNFRVRARIEGHCSVHLLRGCNLR